MDNEKKIKKEGMKKIVQMCLGNNFPEEKVAECVDEVFKSCHAKEQITYDQFEEAIDQTFISKKLCVEVI